MTRLRAIRLAALVAVLAVGTFSAFVPPLNYDAAWLVHVAREWLRGAVLYVDVYETNPPLIVWLTAIPVALSGVVSVPATKLLASAVLALAIGMVLWCARLLRPVTNSDARSWGVLAGVTALLVLPGSQFAQREHIALALLGPYLSVCCLRLRGTEVTRHTALAAGVLAGIAISLKPYFLAVPVLVEWVTAWRGRAGFRRPELFAAFVLIATYPIAALAAHPEYAAWSRFAAAWYDPIRLRDAWLAFVWSEPGRLLAPLAAVLAVPPVRRTLTEPHQQIATAAALGFGAAMLVQGRGWANHVYPTLALAFLAIVSASVSLLRRRHLAAAATLPVLVLALAGGVLASLDTDRYLPRDYRELTEYLKTRRDAGPVVMYSVSAIAAFPAVAELGMDWTARDTKATTIMRGYRNREPLNRPEEMDDVERWAFRTWTDALTERPPATVIIDRRPRFGRVFEFVEYLSQDSSFARLWPEYEPAGAIGAYELYEHRR